MNADTIDGEKSTEVAATEIVEGNAADGKMTDEASSSEVATAGADGAGDTSETGPRAANEDEIEPTPDNVAPQNESQVSIEQQTDPETVIATPPYAEDADPKDSADLLDEKVEEILQPEQEEVASVPEESSKTLRDEEAEKLGKEIFFRRNNDPKYGGWDNLRWLTYSGSRKIVFVGQVSRFEAGRRTLFWSGDQYHDRILAVYSEPQLILVLKKPEEMTDVLEILDLPPGSQAPNSEEVFKSHLIVESVLDPKTCKLRLSPLTTITSVVSDIPSDDHRRRSCFELINPYETITLSAVRLRKGAERALTSFKDSGAYLETTSTEHVLQKSICDAHKPEEDDLDQSDLSWKHQVILGTLHSYVVLGNQKGLDLALSEARTSSTEPETEFVESRIIDVVDESGRTPLHYACSGRFSSAVSSLVKAGANLELRVEPYNMTACHLSALHLDARSLELILSTCRRPNVVDRWGRTPIYLAIMDGRSVGQSRDPQALENCLQVLEKYGGQIESPLGFQHPVSSLAASWSHEELVVVMNRVHYRYPLILPDANDKRRIGISVSALYQYPVHATCIALRKAANKDIISVDELSFNDSLASRICKTLEALFDCGFEPNERIEGLVENFDGLEDFIAHTGYSPSQILGAGILDAIGRKEELGTTAYLQFLKIASSVMDCIVRHGGRLSLDPPVASRSKERVSNSISGSSTGSTGTSEEPTVHNRAQLKLQSNKQILDLLGTARLASAENLWNDLKPVPTTGSLILHTDKLAIDNAEAPGGSDVKSCCICWKSFGTITNRKHRCRISRRHICDECSSKRIADSDEEHRISDGQYLLALADIERAKAQKREPKARAEALPAPGSRQSHGSVTARPVRLESEDAANRDSLFGDVMGKMASAVFGEDKEQSQSDTLSGLSNTLDQTRNQLNERGAKLNTLADKSDRLVNASNDFAKMAKELNRQSQGGFFW